MEVPVLCGPACVRCGDDLDAPGQDASGLALCRACRLAPPAFERAVAYAFFEDPMRAVIHALKYELMHPAARRMGRMLAQAITLLAAEAPDEMLVVPIPLHRSPQAERGFNQARLLAAHALKALRTSHPQWRLTLAPAARGADAFARHREPGQPDHARTAPERARRVFSLRSSVGARPAHPADRRHSYHTGNGAGRSTGIEARRRGYRVGGNAGSGTPRLSRSGHRRYTQHGFCTVRHTGRRRWG